MDPRSSKTESPSSKLKPYSTAPSEMTVITSQPWNLTRGPEQLRDWEMFRPRTEAQSVKLPSICQVTPLSLIRL